MPMNSSDTVEPQSNYEKYLERNAQRIVDEERDIRDREREACDAHVKKIASLRQDLGDVETEDAANERHPKPSPAVTARCETERVKIKAKILAAQQAHDKRGSRSLANLTDEFIRKMNRPHRDVGTTDTVRKNETPKTMHDVFWRSRHAQARMNLKIAKDAPVTKEMVGQNIRDSVAALAGFVGVKSALKPGGRVALIDEVYSVGEVLKSRPDPIAILFATFGEEIVAKWTERALKDFDDSEALTAHERRAAIEKAEAEVLYAERMACFWRREGLEAGIDPGPGYVSNPIAILDIEPAFDFG